jgi:general secretion pathway protein H
MPTSGPGSSPDAPAGSAAARSRRGFTLVELLVVLLLIALSGAVVSVALRDRVADRLDEEADRLVALLEMARAESRVTGVPVRWVPTGPAAGTGPATDFRFIGLGSRPERPTHWLHAGTQAQVVGAPMLVLGPEAILQPQRVILFQGGRSLELATDGLGPFLPAPAEAAQAAQAARP